ncbi:MAG: quinone oxidoreductase [Deltaproteobacteria bacterium]|jgi:NADPH2:quinone reductase|nr:quinone oxidoreductase [Deltaproteobacteria bacterium]
MDKAILLRNHGGPEVLGYESVEVGAPGEGELRVRQTAIGINFHDVYVRTGLYKTLNLPGIPGIEGVGVVTEVGPKVGGFSSGDRVAYVSPQYGAYASCRLLPAAQALRLPDDLDDYLAATILLKGLTAEMLVKRVHALKGGEAVLIHAAAGGVGRLLCQWASGLGALVIGTVGSQEKAEIARKSGCAHAILYRQENFAKRVKDITQNRGVDVVYDSVGRDTFEGSLEALATFGHLVNFGQSSGPVEPFQVSRLAAGSYSLTRPIVFHYLKDRTRLEEMAANLFKAISHGIITAKSGKPYKLAEAAQAHAELESRSAAGPIILLPE